MMKSVLFLALLLGSGLLMGWHRQGDVAGLRRENQALRERAAEAQRLARENAALERFSVDPAELDRLRQARLEVARLRAEVPPLREAARLIPKEAEEQIAAALAEEEREWERLALTHARHQTRKMNKEVKETLYDLMNRCEMVADTQRRHNQGGSPNLPASFPELQARLEAYERQVFRYLEQRGGAPPEAFHHTNLAQERSELLGHIINYFEFVPRIGPLTLADPPAFLLREREPRPLPDGGWVRYYGFSNSGIEEVILPENRFDEWERTASRQ